LGTPFLAEVRMMGFNFAPKNWAMCNGQLLSIQQNAALFAILGTSYGGNGIQNFALPNLQSRTPVHWGTSIQGANYVIGQTGGVEAVVLNQTTFPQHTHTMVATNTPGVSAKPVPAPKNIGQGVAGTMAYATTFTNLTTLIPASLSQTGSNQPHTNIQPYLTVNFCIALSGIFPSRN
jgi:microcystin-dependent protein